MKKKTLKGVGALLFVAMLLLNAGQVLAQESVDAEEVAVSEISAGLIVTGDDLHSDGGHSGYYNWLNTIVTVEEGATVEALIQKGLSENGFGFEYDGYLSAITNEGGIRLGEFDNGDKSGWMFKVNGEMPVSGMGDCLVYDGDEIEVFYCDDYREIYGYGLTINKTPDEAQVVIKDSEGSVVEASWGYYSLFPGEYSYEAECDGYDSQSSSFSVTNDDIVLDIVLEEATTEATTEADKENSGSSGGFSSGGGSTNAVVISEKISEEDVAVEEETVEFEIATEFEGFADVEDSFWASEAINSLKKAGIVEGRGDNQFFPYDNISRCEILAILYRLSGETELATEKSFADVDESSWYAPYVVWAKENEIVNGVGEDLFMPEAFVTREDFVTIMSRFYTAYGIELESTRDYAPFEDEAEISDYARQAVMDFYSSEIINGRTKNTFAPKMPITRAECAYIINNR